MRLYSVPNAIDPMDIDLDQINDMWNVDDNRQIKILYKNGRVVKLLFRSRDESHHIFLKIEEAWKEYKNKKKGILSMEFIKEYFRKHQELIINLAFLFLLDEYVFEGKFRERIKNIVENLFTKTEKKILKGDE